MIAVPSFAKINLGLKIGPARPDGFHELRTVYQTLALRDTVRVEVQPGSGIEIRCSNPRVPCDDSNTCHKIAERVLRALVSSNTELPQGLKPGSIDQFYGAPKGAPLQGRIVIEIEKRLPVQGGLGAASSNAVAAMLGLERALGVQLGPAKKLRIAAEVGSDLPLFLIGGTVLGIGRGEEVHPLPDLPTLHLVVVTPQIGVSTPKAFAWWDELVARETQLTGADAAGTMNQFSQSGFAWLSGGLYPQAGPASGVPAGGGDRAETPLLDLVRAGIENDFEQVVFPEYPDLREVKELLQRAGAQYASLSGSGSTLYGLFASAEEAQAAATRVSAAGYAAVATTTLTREEYWKAVASG
ncbi:MAG: 4-(cytidine 5'-diphospho)-2-C-methyl-D-erythritol kinase [Candidatus Korobacteraceae bacterium]|jgi:4-diphosphocytidyl-2-C-methyl-D-erythritol kinase